MSTVIIVILLLVLVFVAASVVLSRTTSRVDSARDTEYLELEGNWIRYRVVGDGPPVVLVHGWLSSSRIWEDLARRLARRFTVYTLDLSGFGESDKPLSGYGVRYGSRLLYAFCAHFGLTRAAVVGHDVGGAMAVKLAADHQDVVGRVVLVATPADQDQIDLPTLLWLATLPVVGPIFFTAGRYIRPLRALWMRPFVLDPDDLIEDVVEDAGKPTPAAAQKTLEVTRREISRGRLVRQAGIVKVPILLVAGEDDQIVDPHAAEDWSRTLPAEVVLLDECGHLPMLERPAEFEAQILAFLTGDPRHLDTTAEEPTEEPLGDLRLAPPRAEPLPAPPTIASGQHDDAEPEDAADPRQTPDPAIEKAPERPPERRERGLDRSSGSTRGGAGDGERRRDRDRDGAAGVPEVPEGLFEWPESLKEPRPWDLPHDADDRQENEEARPEQRGGEDADPEGPSEGPDDPESRGPGKEQRS